MGFSKVSRGRTLPVAHLSVDDAALVLQITRREAIRQLRRGELGEMRRGRLRCVDPDVLRCRVAGQPLAAAVLEAIMDGRIAFRPPGFESKPLSLMESYDRSK